MSFPALSRRALAKFGLSLGAAFAFRPAGAAEDNVAFESGVMVRMRDGVRLATDIYRPKGKGPFPVILERTPYGRNVTSRSELSVAEPVAKSRAEVARFFVRQGYAVVYQDCRGRYGSEGAFVKYLSDGADGYDCCAWIVKQSWCNGKIGTMGLSYAAHTQGALGCANPPGVTAMFLDSGGFSNAYQGGIRQGGAFELKQVTWAYRAALEAPESAADPARMAALKAIDIKGWFARMPWKRGQSPLTPAPEYEDYVYDQWEHGNFDAYWKQMGIYAQGFYDQFSDAAMMHMSSWYDPYPRTATDNYVGLSKRKKGPVRLILGPWTHGDRSRSWAGEVDFGKEATIDGNLAADFWQLRLRWFDRWLKGEQNGVEHEPAVRLFVMGGGSGRKNAEGRLEHGGKWRAEADWPLPGTRLTPYYFQEKGHLSPEMPQAGIAPLAYRFDPNHPVPSMGGSITSGEPVMRGGAYDQTAGSARPDVLIFETEPLAEDMELTGAITAALWIASDCLDTDFTIKLIDVYPPNEDYPKGFALNLCDGILRCRYRDSWETPAPLTPGQPTRITIETFPTSNLFKKGHKIRLDVSSSNFPHFDLNPNTGGPEGGSDAFKVALNQVFIDRDRPSHILLPVIPSRV